MRDLPSDAQFDGSLTSYEDVLPRGSVPPRLSERRRKAWELGLPAFADLSAPARREPPLVVSVGGGKGGVGKSLLSANLAVCMAQAGLKVLAVDLDVGGANLHTYFGINAPKGTLADLLAPKAQARGLKDLITPSGFPNLGLIAGGKEEHFGGPHAFDRTAMRSVSDLVLGARAEGGYDLVLVDLGAGTHRYTIDFFTLANLGLVTVLPEPTSIENAYLFLKTVLFRFIDNVGERSGTPDIAEAVKNALLKENNGRATGYVDRLRQVAQHYPGMVAQIQAALSARTVGIAVNQIRSQKDIDIGTSMELIGERYFGLSSRYLGYLNYDDSAWKSLRNRRLLLTDFPQALIARRIGELAKAVLRRLDSEK